MVREIAAGWEALHTDFVRAEKFWTRGGGSVSEPYSGGVTIDASEILTGFAHRVSESTKQTTRPTLEGRNN